MRKNNNKMSEVQKHRISVGLKRIWRLKKKREEKQQQLKLVSKVVVPTITNTEPTPTTLVVSWNKTEDLIRIGDRKWIGTEITVVKKRTQRWDKDVVSVEK